VRNGEEEWSEGRTGEKGRREDRRDGRRRGEKARSRLEEITEGEMAITWRAI
jgi:hypothetical protein